MCYTSIENKVTEISNAFRHARTQTNRNIHSEVVKAVLYLNSIYGDNTDKIDMIIELAKKRSLYNPEVKECHH